MRYLAAHAGSLSPPPRIGENDRASSSPPVLQRRNSLRRRNSGGPIANETRPRAPEFFPLNGLFGLLVGLILLTLLFGWNIHRVQKAKLKEYRDLTDLNGDFQLSQREVAQWFGSTVSAGSASSGRKFEELVALFDADKDKVFSNTELFKLFDAVDEFPWASRDLLILGNDSFEMLGSAVIGMVLLLVVLLGFIQVQMERANRLYRQQKMQVARVLAAMESRQDEVAKLERDLARQQAEAAPQKEERQQAARDPPSRIAKYDNTRALWHAQASSSHINC